MVLAVQLASSSLSDPAGDPHAVLVFQGLSAWEEVPTAVPASNA